MCSFSHLRAMNLICDFREFHELTFYIAIDIINPTYRVLITSNDTQQELDLAKNEEFIRRAKEFFKREEDPIWYHSDVF